MNSSAQTQAAFTSLSDGTLVMNPAAGKSFDIQGYLDINYNTIISSIVTGYHGTSGTKLQMSDGTGTSGNVAKYASDGSVADGGIATSAIVTAGAPTVGHASCVKSLGPPIVFGYCSTVVAADGTCTCN
jgi:hypothetical protein